MEIDPVDRWDPILVFMEDHNEPQTIHKVVDDDQEENEVHKAHDCTSE